MVPVGINGGGLLLAWGLFIGRGLFFILTLPLWEGFDEYSHFAVVQYVALEGSFPKAATGNSLEVSRSLRLTPMPWHLREAPEVRLTHDSYWKHPDREGVRASLSRLDPQRPGGEWVPSERLYESQQPPLYYVLAALPYRAMQGLDLRTRVYILRLWNVLLASLAVPLTYAAARHVFGDDRGMPLASALLVAAMPGLPPAVFRVGNDALAMALASAMVLVLVGRPRPWTTGCVLAAGLLTKAYFLSFLPVVAVVAWRRGCWRVSVPVLVAAAPFYAWTLLTTGSLTGEQHDVAAGLFADAKGLMSITQVRWLQAADSTFLSYVWIGNWSFLQVRSWMYHAVALLYAVAAWRALPAMLARRQLFLLGGLIAALLTGIAYHVLVTFRVHGVSSSTGWYLHALVAAEAILLAWGWRGFVGIVASVFVAIDVFGTWAYLLPYYAGYIAHTADGRLAAYPVLARLETVPLILERLSPAGFALPLLGLHLTVLAGTLCLAIYQWRRQ